MLVLSKSPFICIEYAKFFLVLMVFSSSGQKYHISSRPTASIIPQSTVVTIHTIVPLYPLFVLLNLHRCSQDSVVASLLKVHDDGKTWSVVLKEEFPYFVERGKSSTAKCRSCGNDLQKDDLRIKTPLLRMIDNSITACHISVCVKEPCISKLNQKRDVLPKHRSRVREHYNCNFV